MTKLEELKQKIGYTKDKNECRTCTHFSSEFKEERWGTKEVSIKCGKYGFSTTKTSSCNEYLRMKK